MSNALRQALRFMPQEEAGAAEKGGGGGEGADKGDAGLGTVEERAARMGWVPAEKFRGDKEKWTDAATFVKNGEESLPILRERLRASERAVVDLSKTAAEFKKMSDTAFERGYAKSKKDLQAEIKAAAKEGDDKAVDAATEELGALEREKAERKVAADKDPVFDGWAEQNPWYADPDMKLEAEAIAFKMRRKGDKTDGVAFLELVKAEMKKQFPEKFGNPRRAAGGGVERPGGGGEGGTPAQGWDKLPQEAKEAGERYIKQKYYKDKASYAKAYFEQN